jgi:Domain of unknown function (DUF4412)
MIIEAMLTLLLTQAPPGPRPAAASESALKATIRLNVAKVDLPASGAESPLGNLGPLIAQLLTPDGPVEIDYVVADDSTRGEVKGRLAEFGRGTIVLQRVGESSIKVLNPANRTWYELPATASPGMQISTPDVQLEPTGETTTIAGQRAQRFRFTETMHIPTPEGVSLPPSFPSSIELSGDVWSTDAFAGSSYTAIFRTLQAASAVPGMEALTAGGRFPLRIAVRSTMMPGYEIRSEVVSVGRAQPASSLFEVPNDYQQVQAPRGRAPRER